MPPQTPLLTVAIPTLRRLEYLKEAVASALAQDYPTFEVVISDDGGDQALGTYASELARTVARVRYLRTPGGIGLSANWNWCVDHALGTHVVIIGDDDRLLPNFLRTLAPYALRHDVVFCNHYLIDAAGTRLRDSDEQLAIYGRSTLSTGQVADVERVAWSNAVAPSATLVRTTLARALRFNVDLNTPELEFYVRAAGGGASFFFDQHYLAEYRTHPGSETARGLWYDSLLLALLKTGASTEDAKIARERQLARLARTAAMSALAAGRVKSAESVLKTGLLQPRWLRLAAWSAAKSGPMFARQSVALVRLLRRLARKASQLGRAGKTN